MEEAQKAGNARRLFQLIRAIGPRKTTFSSACSDEKRVVLVEKSENLGYQTSSSAAHPATTFLFEFADG
ncbi:hypothetical protein T265_08413 [Opisthorchis viverrini]|uniref:Uncharacterized protein n=1 Tax=Opisthorchis viverrini TaxID=6198 RepID=A0A074ZDT7_OPIVI|nr:hypothetical protein T265_08413 [Opisthorchis viverrini]KER23792.1 hypothetical protein T265_08413 [Opisthorchis viverrini]